MKYGLMDSDVMLTNNLADAIVGKNHVLTLLQNLSNGQDASYDLLTNTNNNNSPDEDEEKEENVKPTKTKKSKDTKKPQTLTEFEKEKIVSIRDYISTDISKFACSSTCCGAKDDCDDNETDETNKTDSKSARNTKGKNIDRIAIIRGQGAITSEEQSGGPFSTYRDGIVSPDFVKLIEKAENDTTIKGIIIRINSPGGSVVASEEIYQAILKAKTKKPVYASMSNIAASGGYYIAMGCDTILAHPNTITGSIGVVGAIPNLSKTLKKLNLNYDTISTGIGNSFFLDPMLPFNRQDVQALHKIIEKTYQRFIQKVALNRNKPFEDTRLLAKGRV